MTAQSVVQTAIPGTGYITPAIDLAIPGITALETLGTWTVAPASFQAKVNGTWWDVWYLGNELVVPIAAGQLIDLGADKWLGVTSVKIRSGTSASPVVQSVDANLALVGYFTINPNAAVLPDPVRTILLKSPYWLDTFPGLTVDESGVCTFDLIRLLADGETITGIVSFSLSVKPADAALDTNPTARAAGTPAISGTKISQRFGNWQPAAPFIKYLVTAIYTTSAGGPKSVSGYLPVWQHPN
jgi:hypothetical protein